MTKLSALTCLLFFFTVASAQDEQLTDLKFNAALYHSTRSYQPDAVSHRYLIDKSNIIVSTDTLTLPFVDDFTTNSLRSFGWLENHITDTFYHVFGNCLAPEGIATVAETFMNDTSWYYTFDTILDRLDSIPKPSISFTFFGPSTSGCFAQTPQTFTYWPTYYTYHFDTATGLPVDSTLVTLNSEIINYAPVIYFAQGENGKLWFDNYAYVNNAYPVNPPTIGVATLDGLNEFGLPYNNSSVTTYGTADYLSSKPINISALSEADSVYLSFFYEAQGLGDYPDKDDSLLVEFKDNSAEWRIVWSDTGYSSTTFVPQQFKQVMLNVPTLPLPYSYYHNVFQFRFRNKASLYGNNDHWHIDYVKLDKNRGQADTIIQDIAFLYPVNTVLKNFTLMPADQFNYPTDLKDTVVLTVRNLDPNANNNPPATNFVKGATELYPTPSIVSTDLLQTFNAADYSYIQVNPAAEYNIPNTPNWPVDSLVIQSRIFINPNDSRPQNDSLKFVQNFNTVMAYDDGSAEKSYGVAGLGLKKFAYEFNLNQPDTLSAFQIQYSQVDVNVSDLVFNFYAWDSLRMNDFTFSDAPVYSLENKKPYYIDSVNGFTTYKLDTPIIVSGKLYFGWAQTDERRLQVGYDLNSTLGRQHMFIYSNATWKPSTISPAGSPMIRLIFDSNFWGGTSAVQDLTKDNPTLSIYPNPTSGWIQLKSSNPSSRFDVTVLNTLGQQVKYFHSVENSFQINDLPEGMYLLQLHDTQSGARHTHKIIKSAF